MTNPIRALLNQPPELICGLYEEFLVSASLDVTHVERLHRVTETIASRYDLSCEKLQRYACSSARVLSFHVDCLFNLPFCVCV